MKLQTKITLKKEDRNPIDYNATLLLLGSCFSENIGNKLNYFKFKTYQNPFGILFHPLAIEKLITNAINNKEYTENDIFYLNERWHCFEAHSSLSAITKEILLNNLNTNIRACKTYLKEATHIIITLGTSWIYRHIESDSTVANCHKIPQKKFLKEIASVDEITQSIEAIILLIKSINKNVNFLFTISPVRHLKDGFIENTQSKSHLIAAVHNIINIRKKIYYFPSYEIMMDQLRDYRFYKEDMIHPNKIAINYIWEKFYETWFTDKTIAIMKEVDTIQKGMLHKPFNEKSKQYQKFRENLEAKKRNLSTRIPCINF